MSDPFTILGLSRTATEAEVKQRWRKLCSEHHPDHGGDGAQFDKYRKAYKSALQQVGQHQGDDLQSMFSDLLRQQAAQRAQRAGFRTQSSPSLDELLRRVTEPPVDFCPICGGTGHISVPGIIGSVFMLCSCKIHQGA